jgi:hypothetical protein
MIFYSTIRPSGERFYVVEGGSFFYKQGREPISGGQNKKLLEVSILWVFLGRDMESSSYIM